MKRYPLLLLAATLFLCSFRSDDPTLPMRGRIDAIVAKYPNVQLSHLEVNEAVVNEQSLKAFDDSLAVLSEQMKHITVTPLEQSNTAVQLPFYLPPAFVAGYTWNGSTSVGSSELGYWTLYFNASFTYYTDFTTHTNIITSVSQNNPPYSTTYSSGGSSYYSYNVNYTPGATYYTLATPVASSATLTFTGSMNIIKTYHYMGMSSTVVANSTTGVNYSPVIYSSSFPFEYPD